MSDGGAAAAPERSDDLSVDRVAAHPAGQDGKINLVALTPADERALARVRSYQLLELVQVRSCGPELDALLALAVERRWPEVECMVHYARYAEQDESGNDASHWATAMFDAAERTGDAALMAAALASRAVLPDLAQGLPSGASGERDLARAVALLDEGGGDPVDTPVAYIACGTAYHRRGLWELALEMYDRAAHVLEDDWPEAYGEIAVLCRRVVTANRLDAVVPLACALTEIGAREAAAELARRRPRLTVQDLESLPEEWLVEAEAVDALLAAIAGEPRHDDQSSLLVRLHPTQRVGYRSCAVLAQAIRALDAGDLATAAAQAEIALLHVDDEFTAGVQALAQNLATLADPPARAWQRYARHSAMARWTARLVVLGAARAQLEAERVMLENQRLSQRAYVDELTGLANRHAYARHLTRLRQAESEDELAVMMVDVDHFKAVNDTFGHPVGDEVLRQLGTMLIETTRASDLAVRHGGDEFLVLLLSRARLDVAARGEQLVAAVAEYPWHEVATGLSVSVSIGVAVGAATAVDELVAHADRRLYQAKTTGRGRLSQHPG